MKINSTRLYEGSGTFTKNGDIDYDINLPAEVAENDFDFFEHYDISNPKVNGVVILVKPEVVIAESDQTTKKYNHKFKIKQLKRYNGSTGFNVSTQDGNVMVINCNEVTNEVEKIIEHFYNDLLHKDRPVAVGTGVIRGPLVE
jgi:hypothetical protein